MTEEPHFYNIKRLHAEMTNPSFIVKDWSKWRGNIADEMESIAIWNKIYWTNKWLES